MSVKGTPPRPHGSQKSKAWNTLEEENQRGAKAHDCMLIV